MSHIGHRQIGRIQIPANPNTSQDQRLTDTDTKFLKKFFSPLLGSYNGSRTHKGKPCDHKCVVWVSLQECKIKEHLFISTLKNCLPTICQPTVYLFLNQFEQEDWGAPNKEYSLGFLGGSGG